MKKNNKFEKITKKVILTNKDTLNLEFKNGITNIYINEQKQEFIDSYKIKQSEIGVLEITISKLKVG